MFRSGVSVLVVSIVSAAPAASQSVSAAALTLRISGQEAVDIPGVVRIQGESVSGRGLMRADADAVHVRLPGRTGTIFTIPRAGQPIVGDALGIDDVALDVRSRATGGIVHVPLVVIERVERLDRRRRDQIADSLELLGATGGAWIGGIGIGRVVFGRSRPAEVGAIVLGGAAAWAAYTLVLHATRHERWTPIDLDLVRDRLHAPFPKSRPW